VNAEVCKRYWSYISQCLRTTIQSLIILETDRPVTIPAAHGQTFQGRGICSGLTHLVKRWESLDECLVLIGYLLNDRDLVSSDPVSVQLEYVGSWVFGNISDTAPWEGRVMTHPMSNTSSAGSSGCSHKDMFSRDCSECCTGGPREDTCDRPNKKIHRDLEIGREEKILLE